MRLLDRDREVRTFEVGTERASCAAEQLAADYPGGLNANSRAAIAGWGDGYGWGAEASVRLIG